VLMARSRARDVDVLSSVWQVHFLFQADAQGSMIELPVAPGNVFEINNVIPHQVRGRACADPERTSLLMVSLSSLTRCTTATIRSACTYSWISRSKGCNAGS
jgi:hypothetical protein